MSNTEQLTAQELRDLAAIAGYIPAKGDDNFKKKIGDDWHLVTLQERGILRRWQPHTCMNQAMEVVERLNKKDLFLSLAQYKDAPTYGPWLASFKTANSSRTHGTSSANTSQLAICRAALMCPKEKVE